MHEVITKNIDLWTSALLTKSTAGRGSNGKQVAYGIKKLRDLILELAVRGKLVPQDPNDVPASILLEKIFAEKTWLIKDGINKREKSVAKISNDEKPFKLPKGWEWVRLASISQANTGYAFKSTEYTESGTFVLRVTNINPDGSINENDSKYIDSGIAETIYEKFKLKKDDVLLVMVGGSLGKLGIVSEACLPAVLNQNMWKLCRFGGIVFSYFVMGLKFINGNQLKVTSSTHGHLAQGEYMDKLFPLPPLAEQHRIVAKVDKLMALCDQMEQQQANNLDAHQTLVETLLGTLTHVASQQELTEAWARIADHFDTLFTTEHSIEQLKQTILQLAVMGKLVPQDPNDGPANELLKRIQVGDAKLIAEGKIKKSKPVPEIREDEMPFTVPLGWEWVRVGSILNVTSGNTFDTSIEKEYGSIAYVKVGDMNLPGNELVITTSSRFIDPDEKLKDWIIPTSSIIFPKRGGAIATNKKRIVGRPIFADLNIMAITPKQCGVYTNYVYLWLLTIDLASLNTGTSVPQINHKDIEPLLFPLPPFPEQQRIIAKVDELMALCDALKARLADAQTIQVHLADTIVEQAIA